MKKLTFAAVGMYASLISSVVYADGVLVEPAPLWRSVIGVGGGVAVTTNLGRQQSFPILNPVTDEFFIYTPGMSSSQSRGLFEGFLGVERGVYQNWLIQTGVAYTQTGSYQLHGTFVQGADTQSANQYNYQYSAVTRQLMAQTKIMRPFQERFYPYFLFGLGASFNTAANYLTSVPSTLTFTREYDKNVATAFAWRVGVGADVDVLPHTRVGIAYRFSDLGRVALGPATIDLIGVPGTLSQSNIYANEVLAQITWII